MVQWSQRFFFFIHDSFMLWALSNDLCVNILVTLCQFSWKKVVEAKVSLGLDFGLFRGTSITIHRRKVLHCRAPFIESQLSTWATSFKHRARKFGQGAKSIGKRLVGITENVVCRWLRNSRSINETFKGSVICFFYEDDCTVRGKQFLSAMPNIFNK